MNNKQKYPNITEFFDVHTISTSADETLSGILQGYRSYELQRANKVLVERNKALLSDLLNIRGDFKTEAEMQQLYEYLEFGWYLDESAGWPVPAKSYLELNDYFIAFFEKLVGEMEAKAN
jgi:hypothetical protein